MKAQEAERRAFFCATMLAVSIPSAGPVMKLLVLIGACVAWTGAAQAMQAVAPDAASAAASEPKTLKERLSDKASDEQRVDNCNVPVARRGSKVRPDSCAH
jgi:hypothetical protein